jgi:hypothetical protein
VFANTSATTDQAGFSYGDETFQRQLGELWPSFDASYSQIDWAFQGYGFDMGFPGLFDDLLS